MPTFGDFSAWIEIDEARCEEYAVEISEDLATVTCWIPSETGKVGRWLRFYFPAVGLIKYLRRSR